MKSISFPEMFQRSSTNITEDNSATLQNLKLLLYSDKVSLFGDPQFGSALRKYLFDLNDAILIDIAIDEIYTAICTFMPLISVLRKDITIINDSAKLIISIKAINKVDFKTNLYNIALFDNIA